MRPAPEPRDDPRATRLLGIDPARGEFADRVIGDLPDLLRPGDLLVVNDAATLPASLRGIAARGAALEVRLAGEEEDGSWRAVLFGAGDWRTRTEDRPLPPTVRAGESIRLGDVRAAVAAVDPVDRRLVTLAFSERGAKLWQALYGAGRPVQYSYAARPLSIWHTQTAYAARPWAVEAPSAGLALTWDLLLELRRRGIELARVTHAAGLSSTGDPLLDARLPLAERYDVSAPTVSAIERARRRGGRIVAVGTTTTRALEGTAASHGGRLMASRGITALKLGAGSERRVVDGILTGVHETDSSHFKLLESFAPRPLLECAREFAEAQGYLGHEFGDVVLVLEGATPL
jgi:S-adenosylmethionine:tRNA ribosyltransferase-isomerase